MFLKVYNMNREYLGLVENPSNLKIESTLETGTQSLSFSVPLLPKYIQMFEEEGYIEMSDYFYIIKEIEMKDKTVFHIYCKPDIEDLTGTVVAVYDVIDKTPKQCLEQIISQTNLSWELIFYIDYPNQVQYTIDKRTVWELFDQIKQDFDFEYWFDTKNKTISVYPAGGMGVKKGNVLMNELRLSALAHRGYTYDFATVLYPYGKNGLTIKDVNNNKEYIENHDYSDKNISAYYFNEDIEYADDLKRIAIDYLKQISAPVSTYRVTATSLPPNLSIGDSILIIDKIKKQKTTKRVVKIVHYPNQPEKDIIELDNEVPDLSKMFYKFQDEYRKKIRFIQENISSLQ